jgi:hypothetical protein
MGSSGGADAVAEVSQPAKTPHGPAAAIQNALSALVGQGCHRKTFWSFLPFSECCGIYKQTTYSQQEGV